MNIFICIFLIIFIIIIFIIIDKYYVNIKEYNIEDYDNDNDNNNDNINNLIIPKKIFQTHKSQEFIDSDQKLSKASNSWKKIGYEYFFFNNKECEEFIKNNFDNNVYSAYMKCPKAVMKADLWRYCVIYINGGIYADADTELYGDIDDISNKKALFVGVAENEGNYLCQWVFAAPPKSPILLKIINTVTNKINSADKPINSENYTEHYIHGFTGPAIFTEAIENYLKENNMETVKNKNDYVNKYNNILYLFDSNVFHTKTVTHLFYGSTEDGWKNTR